MPPLPPVSNVLKFTHIYASSVGLFSCRHFMSGVYAPPSANDMTTLAGKCLTQAVSHFVPLMPTVISLQQAKVEDLTSTSSPVGLSTVASNPGTRPGGALTLTDCVVVDHQIGRRYRGGKPKIFLPFGVEGDLNGQAHWADAFALSVRQAWEAYIVAMRTGPVGAITVSLPVSISYYAGFVPRTDPITGRTEDVPKLRVQPLVDLITGNVGRTIVGSQRRRRTTG